MPCARRHSYSKRLTTSAAVALIGIAEHESLVQAIARKIHRGAAQVRHAFGIDKHMNAQTFHWLPEGCAPRPQEPQREVIIREVVASPKPIRQ